MAHKHQSLARTVALLLATMAVYPVVVEGWPSNARAQDLDELPASFSVPSELPADTVLRVDGSSSMVVLNEALRSRFLDRFPQAAVELKTSRTDVALQALVNGQVDVVAAGRPLTAAERSQGLVEVPIEREKLAIFVGPENTFDGSLTFDQFARIFRGEITDWAEVGGAPGPMRVVDRPDYSDTRRALSTYDVFQGAPFTTGATAAPVDTDETDAVVEALGADGIGYAVVSQATDRSDLRILPMHQTLPDDPRYPYSQYRTYIYNSQNPPPAVLAFLGFVTTAPGEEVVETTAIAAPIAPATESPAGAAGAIAGDSGPEPSAGTAAKAAPAGRFPWWLLGIPMLGGLLWWLLKNKGTPEAAPGAAPLLAAAPGPSRIILTPRHCRRAYAYWEVPDAARAEQRDRGGRDLRLRLFDVTDRDADREPPSRIDQYAVTEDQQDLHLPIPLDDRDYQVELGYVSGENHWLPLAKSDPVRVPACAKGEGEGVTVPGAAVAAAGVAAAGVATAAEPAVIPLGTGTSGDCAIETLTLHSRHNAFLLSGGQMQYLQDQVAATYSLDPGSYLVRIKEGAFNYGDPSHPGEAWVLLWIYGGQVSNLKTGVWVNGTWSTLNGYADTLSLEVDEPARLCAFFIDTFPENNTNAITLSVVRL